MTPPRTAFVYGQHKRGLVECPRLVQAGSHYLGTVVLQGFEIYELGDHRVGLLYGTDKVEGEAWHLEPGGFEVLTDYHAGHGATRAVESWHMRYGRLLVLLGHDEPLSLPAILPDAKGVVAWRRGAWKGWLRRELLIKKSIPVRVAPEGLVRPAVRLWRDLVHLGDGGGPVGIEDTGPAPKTYAKMLTADGLGLSR